MIVFDDWVIDDEQVIDYYYFNLYFNDDNYYENFDLKTNSDL